jgi:hypothetical protein
MSKDKSALKQARKLIDKKNYAEARKLLKNLDDPEADKLLDRIDDLEAEGEDEAAAPHRGGLPEPLQVVLLGLFFTLVFGGVGFLIALAIGIPTQPASTASIAALPTADSAAPTSDANAPTPIPPTEPPTIIPCDAQAWWANNGVPFSKSVTTALAITVNTRPADVQKAKADAAALKAILEKAAVPDCVAAAHQTLLAAMPQLDTAFGAYVNVTTPAERAQTFIKTMSDLLPAVDEIKKLNVATPADKWLTTVETFSRGECLAERWYIETMFVRDYQRFLAVQADVARVNPQRLQAAEAQKALTDIRPLRAAYATEKPPECAKTAYQHYLKAMDSALGVYNSFLNNDLNGSAISQKTMLSEVNAYLAEMKKLVPNLRTTF